jgi:hypothetical protein
MGRFKKQLNWIEFWFSLNYTTILLSMSCCFLGSMLATFPSYSPTHSSFAFVVPHLSMIVFSFICHMFELERNLWHMVMFLWAWKVAIANNPRDSSFKHIPHEVGPSIYICKEIIWEGERKIQQTRTTFFTYDVELLGLIEDARFGCNSYCFLNCDYKLNGIVHNVYQLNTISLLPYVLVHYRAYASWFNFP